MATLLATLKEGLQYKGGAGHWNYIFHRIAGLGTLLFLTIHILDTATVYFFPSLYNDAVGIYRLPPFLLGEIILVLCIIFHGVNGLKIILFDYVPSLWTIENERKSLPVVYGLTLVLWAPAAYIMGGHLVENTKLWIGG